MKIAIAQMTVDADWQRNIEQIEQAAAQSAAAGARLLVLPEGVIARDPDDNDYTAAQAQAWDGPFMTQLQAISARHRVALAGTVHLKTPEGGVGNFFVAFDGGELINSYQKLHPYDAFGAKESEHVTPGGRLPEIFELDGVKFAPIICYDLRFPDLSISLALAGADVIVCPAAWVKGPLKEHHWATLLTARALDTTSWVIGCGEISKRNVGCSRVVDPLGVTVAGVGSNPALFFVDVDLETVNQARAKLPVLANRRLQIGPDPAPVG